MLLFFAFLQRYDLKGSTLGRMATKKQKQNSICVLKDMDLLMNQKKFSVGPSRKKDLMFQVSRVHARHYVHT
jgi:1-phosphatidylinositol-4-phosphate 5-kinase